MRLRVVLVCADPTRLRAHAGAVTDHDIEVEGWCDPFGALGRLRGGARPDLVLLDACLARIDGPSLLAELPATVQQRALLLGPLPPGRWPARITERVIPPEAATRSRLPGLVAAVVT